MSRVFLALGSNLGNRRQVLRAAVGRLTYLGQISRVSSLYETAPVGYLDQPPFLNAVISIETDRSPSAILQAALQIECDLGRVRTFPNAPRTIDIDILLIDDLVIERPTLVVPHPRLHERAFVLVPLSEIAPNLLHPTRGAPIHELLETLGDVSHDVRRIAGPAWTTDDDTNGSEPLTKE